MAQPDSDFLTRELVATLVGDAIRRWRELREMTQAELGERLGVEPETVSRFERGVNLPPLVRLVHIAQALDTDIEHLVADVQPDATDELVLQLDTSGLDDNDVDLARSLFGEVSEWARNRAGQP